MKQMNNEINRIRDKDSSNEEKKIMIKKALSKILTKFKFLWEDQILTGIYKRDQINPLFESLSEEFLNLAIEVEDILNDDKISNDLRTISKNFRMASKIPIVMGGYFKNPIPREIGENLTLMEKIKE